VGKNTQACIVEKSVTIFLNSEVGDYSHFENWEIKDIHEFDGKDIFTVCVDWPDRKRSVEFKVDVSQISIDECDDDYTGDIEVCMYEDHYEVTRTYDYTVKYFWQALLRWD
jgi:hypothetical protein